MAHDFKRFPELTNNQMQFYYFESPHKQITESFNAIVAKVIDGDTIKVKWDQRDFEFPIRLSGIQAPEMNKTGGLASKTWLKDKIDKKEVYIKINKFNRVGKWGRILGEVFNRGMNINKESMLFGFSEKFK